MWGSYYSVPKAIFYLLKGDYKQRNRYVGRILESEGTKLPAPQLSEVKGWYTQMACSLVDVAVSQKHGDPNIDPNV